MATIQLDAKWLKAAAVVMPVKDVRYYLNGVFVDIRARETRIVACDGHHLVALRREIGEQEDEQAPAQIIIPADVIKALKPGRFDCQLTYDPAWQEGKDMTTECKLDMLAGPALTFNPIDGRFPDYPRVMASASKPSGAQSQFNLEYLADFAQVCDKAFGAKYSPELWPNGDAAAAVTHPRFPQFFGVVMPMRGSKDFSAPDWLSDKPAEETDNVEQLRKAA